MNNVEQKSYIASLIPVLYEYMILSIPSTAGTYLIFLNFIAPVLCKKINKGKIILCISILNILFWIA